jgi:hypothetical protein
MKKINHLKKLLKDVNPDSSYYSIKQNKIYEVYKLDFMNFILFDGKNLYQELSLVIYLDVINDKGCFL